MGVGDTWHDHVDATWHLRGAPHGMSHVVHLCERITLSHVSNEEIMGKEKKSRKIKENCVDVGEGIPGIENEAYYNSYSDSPGTGTEVHGVL